MVKPVESVVCQQMSDRTGLCWKLPTYIDCKKGQVKLGPQEKSEWQRSQLHRCHIRGVARIERQMELRILHMLPSGVLRSAISFFLKWT